MGLSIHYSGTIKSNDLIDPLVQEILDISLSLDWKADCIDNKEDELKGVYFSPKNSEPIFLTFLPNGRICSVFPFIIRDKYKNEKLDLESGYTVHVKTQYAGMDAHIAIIKLLRYVKEKYMSKFELLDEGYYWETNSEEKLKAQFDAYNQALEIMTSILENMERVPGESADSLADRIEKLIKERKGK